MKSVVIYASRSGNTNRVADHIATTLRASGEAELYEVSDAPTDLSAMDLIVLGGPTEAHGVTPPMTEYLEQLDAELIKGKLVAAFDTRLAWPRFLSGSAAEGIARHMRSLGATLIVPPESFIVTSKPELQPGELERAENWANEVLAKVASTSAAG